MMMHKILHPKADVERLYVIRKEGGGGLTSIDECVDVVAKDIQTRVKKD